jgi:hypothetical protein
MRGWSSLSPKLKFQVSSPLCRVWWTVSWRGIVQSLRRPAHFPCSQKANSSLDLQARSVFQDGHHVEILQLCSFGTYVSNHVIMNTRALYRMYQRHLNYFDGFGVSNKTCKHFLIHSRSGFLLSKVAYVKTLHICIQEEPLSNPDDSDIFLVVFLSLSRQIQGQQSYFKLTHDPCHAHPICFIIH